MPIDYIKETDKLLIFGDEIIHSAKLKTKSRYKKRVLYTTMCAIHSYSVGILKLVVPPNICSTASEVLFRSLIEGLTNIYYILFSGKSNIEVTKYFIHGEQDRITYANKYKGLMLKYPKWNLEFKDFKAVSDWDKFIQDKNKIINRHIKKHGNKPMNLEKLQERAQIADTHLKRVKRFSEENSLEKQYVLFYQYFSDLVHLNITGINRFVQITPNGELIPKPFGDVQNSTSVLAITYVLYLLLLQIFARQFEIYSKSAFKPFDLIAKQISTSK